MYKLEVKKHLGAMIYTENYEFESEEDMVIARRAMKKATDVKVSTFKGEEEIFPETIAVLTKEGEAEFYLVEEYGCYYGILEGSLSSFFSTGSAVERIDCMEVTAPPSQEWLDRINKVLETEYKINDFEGK